jgi:hypothetical protein
MNLSNDLKSKIFKNIISLLIVIGVFNPLSYGITTTLVTQKQVDKFKPGAIINGNLSIGNAFAQSDIHNLQSLSGIKRINGDLTITFNAFLKNLNGLLNIEYISGHIIITNNASLNECLTIYSLLSDMAKIGGNIVISQNTGNCNTQSDIVNQYFSCGNPGNNMDSDGDNVIDCLDKCPLDRNKIDPEECGCGVDQNADYDGDGVANCLDACPFDKNKTVPGNCGCNVIETPDSDADGVSDCNDECPNNKYRTKRGICGCEAPSIELIDLTNASACNNRGTYDPNDDTFSATLSVYFQYPPQIRSYFNKRRSRKLSF